MGKQRDPKRDQAFEIYNDSGGIINLNVIAAQLGVGDGTLRGWKAKDKWEERITATKDVKPIKSKDRRRNDVKGTERNAPINGTERNNKERSIKIKNAPTKYEESVNDELTEKQRLFCLHYVKRFNATTAAIKAGYSPDTAYQIGYQQLQKTSVSNEIKRIKSMMQHDVFVDVMDIFNKYASIAFADITDYVEFGQKEEIVMTEEGPVIDPVTEEHMTYKRNFVTFKQCNEVDGSLISEVKQGKDGVSVKLLDKMKALEKLEKYFDLLPDHHKRSLENERLKMDKERLELDKAKAAGEGDLDEDMINDWVGAVMDDGGNESADQQTVRSVQEADSSLS